MGLEHGCRGRGRAAAGAAFMPWRAGRPDQLPRLLEHRVHHRILAVDGLETALDVVEERVQSRPVLFGVAYLHLLIVDREHELVHTSRPLEDIV